MSRPASKTELLKKSKATFQNLNGFIEQLSIEQQQKEFPKGIMNRNIRDVLMHLHHWHLMFLKWYDVGMSGKKPVMPAEGYTWKAGPFD